MNKRPPAPLGLHHVALQVRDFAESERFYVDLMGMAVEWRPDADTLYLSGGTDHLALHRAAQAPADDRAQRLDHIGFVLRAPEQVDTWCEWLEAAGVRIVARPRTHRDGARSFYCLDPDGTRVQVIYHPPLAG